MCFSFNFKVGKKIIILFFDFGNWFVGDGSFQVFFEILFVETHGSTVKNKFFFDLLYGMVMRGKKVKLIALIV